MKRSDIRAGEWFEIRDTKQDFYIAEGYKRWMMYTGVADIFINVEINDHIKVEYEISILADRYWNTCKNHLIYYNRYPESKSVSNKAAIIAILTGNKR